MIEMEGAERKIRSPGVWFLVCMYLHSSIVPTRVPPLLLILANKLPTLMMLDNFIDESLVTIELEEPRF